MTPHEDLRRVGGGVMAPDEDFDPASAIAGVIVIALGGLLLLDQLDVFEVGFATCCRRSSPPSAASCSRAGSPARRGSAAERMGTSPWCPCPTRSPHRSAATARPPWSAACARASGRGSGWTRGWCGSASWSPPSPAAWGSRCTRSPGRCCRRARRIPRARGSLIARVAGRRESWMVAAGLVCLLLAALLLLREWGLWVGDAVVWPLVLAAGGGALIWRQSQGGEVVAEPAPGPARRRRLRLARPSLGAAGAGAALVVGGGLVFLWLNGALVAARDVVLAVIVVVVGLTIILAPWWLRLVRGLDAERAERIRSQERAEVAAHLHDSVLQTLALMQKRAQDPREVAALARRQERELRSWLNAPAGLRREPGASLAAALEAAVADVEDAHGVPVDVVAVGDRPLDDGRRGAGRRHPRGRAQRRQVRARRRRSASTPRSTATASRCSCATAGRDSISPPCPPTGAACASPWSGAWSATAGARRSIRCPAPAPRWSWCWGDEPARGHRRRPRPVPGRGALRARRARRRRRRRGHGRRGDRAASSRPSPTWSCSTCRCPTAAAPR